MELKAIEPWTVVIAGLWNRGILSPNWIAKHLFGLPEGEEVEVQVPFNAVLPLKVRHGESTVESQEKRLQIECAPSFEGLAEAMRIGERAITELPKTPFSAVGLNVLYEIVGGERGGSSANLEGVIDERLKRKKREVTLRSTHRKYRWREGQALVVVEEVVGHPMKLAVNLERQSRNEEDLKAWLRLPVPDVSDEVKKIQAWF